MIRLAISIRFPALYNFANANNNKYYKINSLGEIKNNLSNSVLYVWITNKYNDNDFLASI